MTRAPAQLWTAARAAAADRHTIDVLGMPSPVLMERAALCASAVVERFACPVLVLCGPGNNGGDGLALARQLIGRGRVVAVVLIGERPNPAHAAQLALARSHGVPVLDGLPASLEPGTLIVDALLGTGSRGAPRGAIRDALIWLAGLAPRPKVIAIDVPSGVDVDRGVADELAVQAAITVTFQRSKPGLHVTPGRDRAGEVVVAEIGLIEDPSVADEGPELIDPRWIAERLAELPEPRHKGSRGHVGVIGGSPGTPGAAILAGSAALRAGAGLVTLAGFDPAMQAAVIASRPELMLSRDEFVAAASVLVVGPGLTAAESLARLPELDARDARAMVWDASGLDAFAPGRSAGPRILTPHPGEAARLLARLDAGDPAWTNARVQADRMAAASLLAARSGAIVVLKGGGTIVAEAGRLAIAIPGGPSLSTAGSGDVLAGTIGALLARGLAPWAAACIGVHVHGMAGDASPSLGTVALDVAEGLPDALDRAARGEAPQRWPSAMRG
ncbi:NAD(P)H-hydrate dehydratase [Nannocystaceae bacterium ST9]